MRLDERYAPEYFEKLFSGEFGTPPFALANIIEPSVGRQLRFLRAGNGDLTPEVALALVVYYVGEVDSGGHTKFFLGGTGAFARATLQALGMIGLVDAQDVLSAAISKFPSGKVPEEDAAREALVEQIYPLHSQFWRGLDRKLSKMNVIDGPEMRRFLERNREHFMRLEV